MRHPVRATIVAVTTIAATSVMAPAATAVEPTDSTSAAGQTQGWLCRLLKLC